MVMTSRLIGLISLASFVFLSACSTFNSNLSSDVSYLESVKQNYEAGERALANQSYEEAIAYFEHVRSKYPYSKYAPLSDLRLADVFFIQEKWLEAADAYDFYLRFHPRHEQSAYAWFQIAKSYFNLRPTDFFILPPSYLKDLTATHEALKAIDRFLVEYPSDNKVQEAKKMKMELRFGLASRDMSIAQFYADREKWPAAVVRYESVYESYPDIKCAAEALLYAAKIVDAKLKNPAKALVLLEKLMMQYKDSSTIKEAKILQARLASLEVKDSQVP